MRWLRTIAAKLLSLFVDDGAFAMSVLAWLLVVWLLPRIFGLPELWRGPLLFCGLAALLVESALRRARGR